MTLKDICLPVEKDLNAVGTFMQDNLCSTIPLVNRISHYIIDNHGKRLRPLLVILCAKSMHYDGDQHIHLAAIIELIHTATLLHDDVIDHAEQRRCRKTANAIWGNTASVLAGDFLHSYAFKLIVKLNHPTITTALARSSNRIVEGEMMQLMHRSKPFIEEADCFAIIDRKTAELFSVAAYSASLLTKQPKETYATYKAYGYQLGMAYQLMDDLLDYHINGTKLGKKRGNDLAESKVTLPFVYALRHADKSDTKCMKSALKHGDNTKLDDIVQVMEKTNALKDTFLKAKQHIEKADQLLKNIPTTTYKDRLHDLGQFILSHYTN